MTKSASTFQSGGISAERLRLATTLRPLPVAEFIDKVGERRIIQVGHNRRLRVKNTEESLIRLLSCAASKIIGSNIRRERARRNYTAKQLGAMVGIQDAKNGILQIEKAIRLHGIHTGTIYAITLALCVPIDRILPSIKEVLESVEFALEWKQQKLGMDRFAILNHWRYINDLPPIDETYLYKPQISNDISNENERI